jgi:hypothetical protein
MKRDNLVKVTEESVRCRVCGLHFVPEEADDRNRHREDHEKLARGGLPLEVREFLKAFGWAVAHNDGVIDRIKDRQDREVGKLAVAFSWWSRARMNGAKESDFDKYMAAHLKFIDAEIEGDEKEFEQASIEIKQWEKYAG